MGSPTTVRAFDANRAEVGRAELVEHVRDARLFNELLVVDW